MEWARAWVLSGGGRRPSPWDGQKSQGEGKHRAPCSGVDDAPADRRRQVSDPRDGTWPRPDGRHGTELHQEYQSLHSAAAPQGFTSWDVPAAMAMMGRQGIATTTLSMVMWAGPFGLRLAVRRRRARHGRDRMRSASDTLGAPAGGWGRVGGATVEDARACGSILSGRRVHDTWPAQVGPQSVPPTGGPSGVWRCWLSRSSCWAPARWSCPAASREGTRRVPWRPPGRPGVPGAARGRPSVSAATPVPVPHRSFLGVVASCFRHTGWSGTRVLPVRRLWAGSGSARWLIGSLSCRRWPTATPPDDNRCRSWS